MDWLQGLLLVGAGALGGYWLASAQGQQQLKDLKDSLIEARDKLDQALKPATPVAPVKGGWVGGSASFGTGAFGPRPDWAMGGQGSCGAVAPIGSQMWR